MDEVTFQQMITAEGGSLPWQKAGRITAAVLEMLLTQQDVQTTYTDVTPESIRLTADGQTVLACGSVHPLKDWDTADCADRRFLPWELQNQWSYRTPSAQIYPVAACLYAALYGVLPPSAEERLNGAALESAASRGVELPAALEQTVQKGLALNANDRYATLAEFRTAVLAAAELTGSASPIVGGAAPIDLTKVRTIPAPKGPQEVYHPTEKSNSGRAAKLVPVAVLAAAFAVGLLSYKAASRTTPSTQEILLPASTSSSSSAVSSSSSASSVSSASASESVASSAASSEQSASTEAPAESEAAASSASSSTSSSSVASSSSASASSSKKTAAASRTASSVSVAASSSSSAASSSSVASSAASASSDATQTLTLEDGSRFVGTVDGTKRTGTLTTASGDVYTGTFTNGVLEGTGTLKTASGDSYNGSFSGGKANGSGTMTYANGTVYTGSWSDGQRSGSGTMKYPNGDSFTGSWANDVKDGSGTYTWANGTTYSGKWEAGRTLRGGTYNYSEEGMSEMFANGGSGLTMQE